ncbi:MAG: carboxypeptidase M32 [Armatimonadota bacterium]|nr:carboxypeptidase M32 [Armatimonadota bacterium]MDR7448028.1 carboxypeptidase M32 [Armatimonadota bacterium]MDR7478623.1 carboxypeptidase M32 [Armatimonadota bacterium]MDR7488399.1 carboxypeptidase M32 [Armatimonadota bacterium]MDR7489877.1 carboxypeptidase M32 [Armatimonadota bacterium]
MPEATSAVQRLREHLAPIVDIHGALAILGWDQQTCMPPAAGRTRAEQRATLGRLAHELFTSAQTRELLTAAEREVDGLDPDSDEARLVRVVRRDLDRALRLPAEFVAERARAAALSVEAWRRARPANDFAAFAPWLEQMVTYARRTADYVGYQDHPYDALLDSYEPGMTAAEVRALFHRLREATVPLVRAIDRRGATVDAAFLRREYDEARQEAFGREVAAAFGYDWDRGRLDRAPHPFASGAGRDDVRITARYHRRYLPTGIFSIFHETGHALYEQGTDPTLARTPLARGASLGMHESQSRLWENLVGRSRAFWRRYFPTLRELFPEALRDVDVETFYRAVNLVEPGLIRTEADEVTYNLHIILRFDLEVALLEGAVRTAELPEAWRAKMLEYLGRAPATDADGVLQDIHWAQGSIGYFPTYTLGNVISAQLFAAARAALPDLEAQIEQGAFAPLLGWLREHVHRHGRKFLPRELLERATGQAVTLEPYLEYLWSKYGDIYGVARVPEPSGAPA